MLATIGKALVTAAFIVLLSEVAKRSTWLAAAMVALPLATMLTVGFIYWDTKDHTIANQFAMSTFLLVFPGLCFFAALPLVQRAGLHFWPAFAIAVAVTFAAAAGFTVLYRALGLKL